jgi:hypothetical protein
MIGAIVTLGFGSFAGTQYVPTLGFTSNVEIVIAGPFYVMASQAHNPGALSSQYHAPGCVKDQSHTPGSTSAQAE